MYLVRVPFLLLFFKICLYFGLEKVAREYLTIKLWWNSLAEAECCHLLENRHSIDVPYLLRLYSLLKYCRVAACLIKTINTKHS